MDRTYCAAMTRNSSACSAVTPIVPLPGHVTFVPAVTVQQEPLAMNVLKAQAQAMKAPLSVTGVDIDFSFRFETSREHGPHTRICLSTPTSKFEHLRVPLHGRHQAINCGLALALLDKLKSAGYQIDNEKSAEGLNQVKLAGRME
jgi:dihydrofolate synthase/folylpolyglutamate synthase